MSIGVGKMSGSMPALVRSWVDITRGYGIYYYGVSKSDKVVAASMYFVRLYR